MEQRQSITMSKQDSSGVTVLGDLPESIIAWEILIRLPAEDILRCSAVCKLWCHATSARDFLLTHHRRQPSLLLIDCLNRDNRFYDGHLCVFCGDHAGATSCKLRPILWYADHKQDVASLTIHAACDGFLVVSYEDHGRRFDICNPTTRQRAPLLLLPGPRCCDSVTSIRIAGFYKHCLSREYSVLYSIWTRNENDFASTTDFYVLTVGSDEPRPIGQPPTEQSLLDGYPSMKQGLLDGLTCSSNVSIFHRGSLHWGLKERYHSGISKILVFNTADETFRWMSRPTGMSFWTLLLEIDSALAICTNHNGIVVDIYMMQDYEAEVWAFKYRIDLSALQASLPLDLRVRCLRKIAVLDKHELLIELDAGHIVHCNIDGKFLGHVKCNECEESRVHITPYRFQENIIPLPFLEMQEDYDMLEAEDDDEIHYFIWPHP